MTTPDVRAFDALGQHARLADLVAVTRTVASAAAEGHLAEWKDAVKVKARAMELKLEQADAATPFGNALAVLERGPEDDSERALARALFAHSLAESPPKGRDDEDRFASDALWLASHTPFDATGLFDRALGDGASEIWDAVADRVRRVDQGRLPTLGRGEALIGCTALAMSASATAQKHAASLASEVKDAAFVRVLSGRPRGADEERIVGELAPAPRGFVVTALLALTGILFIVHAARFIARLALAYKRPAEVTISQGSVRVEGRTEMLGRTLREHKVIILREGLARAVREVRYPRAGFYAGLLALAIGSYVGIATLVDGVRSASPSLLFTGLLIVCVGIALDFALGSLAPGAKGKCRVVLVPRKGPAVCVAGVDAARADAALAKLTQQGAEKAPPQPLIKAASERPSTA